MMKLALIALGISLTLIFSFIAPIPVQLQGYILFSGILLLGIPHGAADQLVSQQTACIRGQEFSKARFFRGYMVRLLLFGILFFFFPLTANLLFLVLSAYHFGETDLNEYWYDTVFGKVLAFANGVLIISVILLAHLDELQPIYLFAHAEDHHVLSTEWLKINQIGLIAGIFCTFCTLLITYHISSGAPLRVCIIYLTQLLAILFIVSQLPLLLAFMFYFVAWHSVLSIHNIITYLQKDGLFSTGCIIWQLTKNTLIVYAGIVCIALLGYSFFEDSNPYGYLFIALALLTAPHLPVMHEMYSTTSPKKRI